MKREACVCIIVLMILSAKGICQPVQPTEDKALVRILVHNPDDLPIRERLELVAKSTGKTYQAVSNEEGIAALLVPAGDIYTLNMKYEKAYDIFSIPEKKYHTLNYKIYYNNKDRIPEGFAQVRLSILTKEGDPLSGEMVYLVGGNTRISGKTDEDGKLVLNIPNNSDYRVDFKDAPNYESFTIPDSANYFMNFGVIFDGSGKGRLYPTLDKALIDFTYLDLDDHPVINDTFSIREIGGDAYYEYLTDDSGKVCVLVPVGRSYSFSTPSHQDFQKVTLPAEAKRQTINLSYKGLSANVYYERLRQRQKALRERDSIYQARLQAYQHFQTLSMMEQIEEKKKEILERALKEKEFLKQEPKYFINIEQTVNAVFYRNLQLWKTMLIVMDVTCSMDPYLDQLLIWHAMNLMIDKNNEYIFFNDGDGKMQEEKLIGRTGGLHYTNATEFDSVINFSWLARRFGCSGDGAENDFEALLEAVNYYIPGKEIILIADNLSDVRDYELLRLINVPVRIILCGVNKYVNEQYLDLAYHTRGSVHTLEEDMEMLSRLADGNRITYLGIEYVFSKGRFIYKE